MLQLKNYKEALLAQVLEVGSSDLYVSPDADYPPVPFIIELTEGYTLFDLRNSERVLCYEEVDSGHFKIARNWDNNYSFDGPEGTCTEVSSGTELTIAAGTAIAAGHGLRFYTHRQLYRVISVDGTAVTLDPPVQEATGTSWYVCTKDYEVSQEREHGITEYGLITPGFANFEELQDSLTNLRFPNDIYGHSLTLAEDAATVASEGTVRYQNGNFEGRTGTGWVQLNNVAGSGWTPPLGADGQVLTYVSGDLVATSGLALDMNEELITATWALTGGQISATTFLTGDLTLDTGGLLHADALLVEALGALTLKAPALTLDGPATLTALAAFQDAATYAAITEPSAPTAGTMYYDAVHGFRYYNGVQWVNMGADGTALPVGSTAWSTLHYHPINGWEATSQLLVSTTGVSTSNSITIGPKAQARPLEAGLIEFVNNDFQGIVRFGNSYRRVSFTSGLLAANTLPTGVVENSILAYNGELWEERPALLAFSTYMQMPQLKLGLSAGDEGKVQYDASNKVLTYHNGTGWAPIDGGGGGGGLVPIPTADSKMLFSQGGAWVEASSITFDDLTISVPALTTPDLTATLGDITTLTVGTLTTESLSLEELILPEDATLAVGQVALGTWTLTSAGATFSCSTAETSAMDLQWAGPSGVTVASEANCGRYIVQYLPGVGLDWTDMPGRTFIWNGVTYTVVAAREGQILLNGPTADVIPVGTNLMFSGRATARISKLEGTVAHLSDTTVDRLYLTPDPHYLLAPLEGQIRYNGDFQGCLLDENGDTVWASFTLSLADGQMDAADYGSVLYWDSTQWVYSAAGMSSEGALRLAHAPNAGAVEGALRFNATTHEFEGCADTGTWITLGTGSGGGGAGSVPVGTIEDSSLRWNGAAWVEATTVKINPYYVHAPLFKMPEYATIVAPPLPVGGMVRYNQNDYEGFMTGIGWVSFTGRQDVLPKPEGDPLLSIGNIVYFNGTQWVADHSAYDLDNVFYLHKHFAPDSVSCDTVTTAKVQMYTETMPETAPEGRVLFDGTGFKGRVGEEWVSLASVIREVDAVAGQTLVRGADALWYNTDALTITDAVTVSLDTLWLDNWAFKSEVGYLEGTEAWRLALNHRVDVEGSWVVTEYEYARTNPNIRVSKLSHLLPKLYVGTAGFEALKEGAWEQTELLHVAGTMTVTDTLTAADIAAANLTLSGDLHTVNFEATGATTLDTATATTLTTSGAIFGGSYVRVGYTDIQPPRGSIRYSTPGNLAVGDWEGWDGTQWVSLTGGFYGQPISGAAITDGVVAYDGSDYRSFASLLVTDDAVEATEPVTLIDLNVKAPGGSLAAVRYTGTDLQTSFDGGANWLSLVTQPDTDTLPLQLPPNGIYRFSRPWNAAPEITAGTCAATARGLKTMLVSASTAPSVGQVFSIDGSGTQAELGGHTVETVDSDGTDHVITFSIPLFYDVEEGATIHFFDPGDGQWQYDTSLRIGERIACARVLSLDPWEALEVKPSALQGGYLRFAGNDFQGYIAGRGWVSLTEQASIAQPRSDGRLLTSLDDRWVEAPGLSYAAGRLTAVELSTSKAYLRPSDGIGASGYLYQTAGTLYWQPPTGGAQTLSVRGIQYRLPYYETVDKLGSSQFAISTMGSTLSGPTFSGGLKTNSLAASASYIPVVSPITFQEVATFEAAIQSSAAITTSGALSAGATTVASLASSGALSGTTLNLSDELTVVTGRFNTVSALTIFAEYGLIAGSVHSSKFGRLQRGSFGTLVLAEELTPVAGSVRYTGTVFAPDGEWVATAGSGYWEVFFHCGEIGIEAGDWLQSSAGLQAISAVTYYATLPIGDVVAPGYGVRVSIQPSGNLLVRYKHGDFQGYDGSNWVSFTGYDDTYGTIGGGGGGALPDFDIDEPANHDHLEYYDGVWRNTNTTTTTAIYLTPQSSHPMPALNTFTIAAAPAGVMISAVGASLTDLLPITFSASAFQFGNLNGVFVWSPYLYRTGYPSVTPGGAATTLSHTYAATGDIGTTGTYITNPLGQRYQTSLPLTLTDGAALYFDLATSRWLPYPHLTMGSTKIEFSKKVHINTLMNVSGCVKTAFGGTYEAGDTVFDGDYNMYIALQSGTYTGQSGFWGKHTIEAATPPVDE